MRQSNFINIGFITFDFHPFLGGMGRYLYDVYYNGILTKPANIHPIFFSPWQNQLDYHEETLSFTTRVGKTYGNVLFSLFLQNRLGYLVKKHNLAVTNIPTGPGGLFLLKKPRDTKLISITCHTYAQQSHYIPGQQWKKLLARLEQKTLQLSDHIITISPSTKEAIHAKYQIPKNKITIISPCVNTQEFHPDSNVSKIPKSMLYVGRLDKRKGIDRLLKLMPTLIRKDHDIKLFIGGTGGLSRWIKDYINSNDLQDNVALLGFIPEEDLNKWYNKVSALIVPSIFEGFGIVAIESMATGTPVIANYTDGLKDIIEHGNNGFFVNFQDLGSASSKIAKYLNQIERQRELISNCLKTVNRKFTCERSAQKAVRFYNQVLKS